MKNKTAVLTKSYMFKIIAVLLSFAIVFNLAFSFSFTAYAAPTKDELEDKISDVQAEREKQQALLDSLKNDITKQEEYVTELYKQIDNLQVEIDLYQEKINALNVEVDKINEKIDAKNLEIQGVQEKIHIKELETKEVRDQLGVRLKAVYMSGSGSTLELLLSADDLSSYLMTSEMLKRISENDRKIIESLIAKINEILPLQNELKAQKKELDGEKAKLVEKRTELEKEQKVFTDRQTEISLKYQEANEALQLLDKESQAYKNQIQLLNKQEEQLEQQIQNIITQSKPSGGGNNYVPSTNPTGYANPVPYADRYISSPYGMRTNPVTGVYKLHAGVDISCGGAGGKTGPFTKQVVASKAGTVSYVGWVSGYGNTVMITHDDGFLTLYAHNYALNVTVGQRVNQGQQIAIMGNTGNSDGAHCHFEIRDGMWGNTMDPAPYIPR